MPGITCCKGCEPPKRRREPTDCHMTCETYLEQRAAYERDKEKRFEYKRREGSEADWYSIQAAAKRRHEWHRKTK